MNTDLSKLIFKTRGKNLEIKAHKKWKYNDNICVGCEEREETEEEFLSLNTIPTINENLTLEISVQNPSIEISGNLL